MFHLASERTYDEKIENCIYVVSGFLKLPLSDSYFDVAFSSYGIENVSLTKIKMALGEMKRVVRKGGFL